MESGYETCSFLGNRGMEKLHPGVPSILLNLRNREMAVGGPHLYPHRMGKLKT